MSKELEAQIIKQKIPEGAICCLKVEVAKAVKHINSNYLFVNVLNKLEPTGKEYDQINKILKTESEQEIDFILNENGEIKYVSNVIDKYLESLNAEILQLKEESNELKSKKDDLNEKYIQSKQKIKELLDNFINDKIKDFNNEINKLQRLKDELIKYKFLSDEVNYKNENINSFEDEIQKLIVQGDKDKLSDFKRQDIKADLSNLTKLVEHIQNYLAQDEENPLYYSKDLLYQFISSLRTNQLVILAGRPGTGKSSLVEGFAKATGAIVKMIPVQPNWTDKSDLLGFYNPVEKTYVSTPFLEAILTAIHNKDKLFYICLDEMNLAHIEYYFAEFLSKLQTDRKIDLYSSAIQKQIEEEITERYNYFKNVQLNETSIESFLEHNQTNSINDYFYLKKQLQFIMNYPATIEVPNNIRFIGTINKDETTKELSPKVIDRSFLIKIDDVDIDVKNTLIKTKKESLELLKPLVIRPEDIIINKEVDDTIEGFIEKILKALENAPFKMTNRFVRTVYQLNLIIKEQSKESSFNFEKLEDIIIASLILPKINFDNYDIDLENINKLIKNLIGANKKLSSKVYKDLLVKSQTGELESLTYWR